MNTTCFTFSTAPPGHAEWVPNASCRGTSEIISSCLSTTVICIWSSVHRDIQLKRSSTFRALLRDTPLVLIALLAPELLLFHAFSEFLRARELVKIASKSDGFKLSSDRGTRKVAKIQRLLNFVKVGRRSSEERDYEPERSRGDSEVNECRQNAFSLTHGFYVTGGGFAFYILNEDGTTGTRKAKLTSEGVKYLMERHPNLIPDLSITSITDRSKSSGLGKAILTVQVV